MTNWAVMKGLRKDGSPIDTKAVHSTLEDIPSKRSQSSSTHNHIDDLRPTICNTRKALLKRWGLRDEVQVRGFVLEKPGLDKGNEGKGNQVSFFWNEI
jgi:hypothetical protein